MGIKPRTSYLYEGWSVSKIRSLINHEQCKYKHEIIKINMFHVFAVAYYHSSALQDASEYEYNV